MKKKIVISSILTIAICLSLIVGSSFALFTSEDELNVTVNSGTVKITAKADPTAMKTYAFNVLFDDTPENATCDFEDGGIAKYEESTLKVERMTPGDKVVLPVLIENASDVAIQYRVTIKPTAAAAGTVDLADALVVTAASTSGTYTATTVTGTTAKSTDWIFAAANTNINLELTVEFPNGDAAHDNLYQGLTAGELTIVIEAVQGNGVVNGELRS